MRYFFKYNCYYFGLLLLISASFCFSQIISRDTSFTVHSAYIKEKKKFPFIEVVKSQLPENVTTKKNIVYSDYNGRELHLDIFCPKEAGIQIFPAVILVHGGGWKSGDRTHQIPMAQQLAARGYVTATIEYRLSPEAKYPAAVCDIKTAVRWLRTNADNYPIDTNKIALLGCSSGGHLAALAGNAYTVDKYNGPLYKEYSDRVQAIVDIDGILDLSSEEARKYEDDPRKNPSSAGAWFGGNFTEKSEIWIEASPKYYVTKNSPPILFLNSSRPRFHVGRDEMIEELKKYNIYYEVHEIPDTPHPFWLFYPWFEPSVKIVGDFLDKVFQKD